MHHAVDARIFTKQCRTLLDGGYRVELIAPADADESRDGVHIIPLPRYASRTKRMILGNVAVVQRCLSSRARLCHFHDPELFPSALLLRLMGRVTIIDIHEDLPGQILTKRWLPRLARAALSRAAVIWERLAELAASQVVIAEPGVFSRFNRSRATLVQNFPQPEEFPAHLGYPYIEREPVVAYVGGIASERGLIEMIRAMSLIPSDIGACLKLAGTFPPTTLRSAAESELGWSSAEALGWLSRAEVADLLSSARVGIVVLHPIPNYVDSQPTKLFEYMVAGLPVVASDFPRWRVIIESAECGLLVDPQSPTEIASAITWLLANPDQAEAMGRRGRDAILREYSWDQEGRRLLRLYDELLSVASDVRDDGAAAPRHTDEGGLP